ncbi:MAG: Spy/CpxP family protein refolding chaperone [Labilithrix sp.]|nr:Spy/CpxP family protein refolding chaperone [Labilithrix sp.]
MKKVRSFAFALALATGSLAAIGCGGTVEQPQTAAGVSKAPVGQNTHGVVKLVGDALGEVPLRPDQRVELEKLAQASEARHVAMADGRKELMLAVADQVEKGAIDKGALQPKIDRIVADLEKSRPEDRAALARVHAILDADQRNLFVDALESRFKGKHHRMKGGEGGEHGERGHHKGKHGFHGMKQLAEDLKLTDEQKSQIKDALMSGHEGGRDRREMFRGMHERMSEGKQALESFRTDKFDANAAGPSPDKVRVMAAAGSTRFVGAAEKVLPILTPEQRKIAADKLRQIANSGGDLPFAR